MTKKKPTPIRPTDVGAGEIDIAQINERAVLVYLGTGAWTASIKDKDLTEAAIKAAGAAPGSHRVTKVLLPGAEELDAPKKTIQSFRAYHYSKTTAFGRDGWALLPSRELGDYKKTFIEHRELWQEQVDAFGAAYPDLKNTAQQSLVGLGRSFKESDYPSARDVIDRFKFTSDVRRIRESNHDLLGVSDDLRAEIMAEADTRVRAGLEESVKDIIKRISETVGNVAEVLGKTNGKKAPKVYDSLVENVKALAESIPTLNITGNPEFNRIADDIVTKLGGLDVEDLKGMGEEAVAARKEAAESAESIMADLSGVF